MRHGPTRLRKFKTLRCRRCSRRESVRPPMRNAPTLGGRFRYAPGRLASETSLLRPVQKSSRMPSCARRGPSVWLFTRKFGLPSIACVRGSAYVLSLLQEIEHLEKRAAGGSRPASITPFAARNVPRRTGGLMIGKPRQQLSIDNRPIRLQAVVHTPSPLRSTGTVHRKREPRTRRPGRRQRDVARQRDARDTT